MSRPNYTKLAVEIYRTRPSASDGWMVMAMGVITGRQPKVKTIDYWKTQARKAGVPVPDRRRK